MNKKTIQNKINRSGYSTLSQKEKDFMNATDMSEIIYNEAIRCIGRDISPKENEYGCMESVNSVVMFAIGEPICYSPSTKVGFDTMIANSNRFKIVAEKDIKRGDIIISPTGLSSFKGSKLSVKNGHIGIISDKDIDTTDIKIMSNTSKTSLWEVNYTIKKWKARWGKSGYPLCYFRVLS